MTAIRTPDYNRIALNDALSGTNPELAAFHAYASKTIPEVALTEFAARLCYNSTSRLGSAPNFVKGVLEHGHLSVAEHASVAMRFPRLQKKAVATNRFFTHSAPYICGNMRSWIELLASTPYSKEFEIFLAVFPPAFANDPILSANDPKTFVVPQPVFVPSFPGCHLLAVNFGTMLPTKAATPRKKSWGRFTFLLEGMSRACSHQIARHRGASISEQSLRYVDAKKIVDFVYPPDATDAQKEVLKFSYEIAFNAYSALRESGMKKEDARFALPLAMKTRMVISFDKPELLHFLNVRCAKDAQWEVRDFAEKMAIQALLATQDNDFKELVERFDLGGKVGG